MHLVAQEIEIMKALLGEGMEELDLLGRGLSILNSETPEYFLEEMYPLTQRRNGNGKPFSAA